MTCSSLPFSLQILKSLEAPMTVLSTQSICYPAQKRTSKLSTLLILNRKRWLKSTRRLSNSSVPTLLTWIFMANTIRPNKRFWVSSSSPVVSNRNLTALLRLTKLKLCRIRVSFFYKITQQLRWKKMETYFCRRPPVFLRSLSGVMRRILSSQG
mgnify:CR=1 FL=1